MSEAPAVLNTFALSHYCENARWVLDHKRAAYTEKSWAPMLHVARTWRMPKTCTPILRIDGKVIQESAAICEYLDRRFPEPALVPRAHRDAVLRAADEARSIGPDVRRLAYLAIGEEPERLRQAWALNLTPAEARLQKLVFPMTHRMVFKALDVNQEAARKSDERVRRFLEDWGSRLGDGRRYLVGDRFTLADLTAAAMLSPLARPAEHPFYSRMPLGEASRRLVASFQGDRMVAWVRDLYARHRAHGEARPPLEFNTQERSEQLRA